MMSDSRSERHEILNESYQKNGEDYRIHSYVPTATATVITNDDASNSRSTTTIFPDDVMLHCFMFLTLSDLSSVQLTSCHWNTIVNTKEKNNNNSWLWKHAYDLRFLCRVHVSNNTETQECKQQIKMTMKTSTQSKVQRDWKYHCKHRLTMAAGDCNPSNFSTKCFSSSSKDSNALIFENTNTGLSQLDWSFSILSRSIRSKNEMFVYAKGWSYFEATVWGQGSVGIVSISTKRDRRFYGKESQNHIGWQGSSYGYHNDDGNIYASDESSTRYKTITYGPTWGSVENGDTSSVVGCGYNSDTNELFFTLDGNFLGLVPCKIQAGVSYAAGVTLHKIGDRVQINSGRLPFLFDIDQFCFKS